MPAEAEGRRRPTMREVARAAGVSHQTVSRYIQFDGAGMKSGTRERISAAIDELGYRPNLTARAMRTHRTGRLAVLLPAGSAASSLPMLTGATAAAHASGYHLEVVTLDRAAGPRTERVNELADSGQFEGLVSLTPLLPDLARPAAPAVPVIVAADYDSEMRALGEMADGSPVAELMEKLAADGHRCFLHVAGDRAYATARSREQVYLETIERLGLRSAGVAACDWAPESARQAVLDLPAGTEVTAVIAANDVLAAGVIHGATERGWRVPEDLSVTGWDNNPVGAWLPPTLTTVDIDFEALGRRAMNRLISVLQGAGANEPTTRVTQVLWRGSTARARPEPGSTEH
ncbi:LacI family DNA-binding transcriptional regulator [Streptomyces sp. NPDC005794]|uniref:LacI family DNA-binding transcriptional regulator n=1 Tax=Streptomyces sp. NPDC005794 TaxID=3364733 RepID=UPI0036AA35D7